MSDQNYIAIFYIAGTLLFMLFAFFIIYSSIIQKRIQYDYKLEKVKMQFEHENNILRVKIEEQESAFDTISKELHDNVKSKLGISQLNLYRVSDLGVTAKQSEIVDSIDKTIAGVIDEVHDLSQSLNSNFIKNIGLNSAISDKLASVKIGKNINS